LTLATLLRAATSQAPCSTPKPTSHAAGVVNVGAVPTRWQYRALWRRWRADRSPARFYNGLVQRKVLKRFSKLENNVGFVITTITC